MLYAKSHASNIIDAPTAAIWRAMCHIHINRSDRINAYRIVNLFSLEPLWFQQSGDDQFGGIPAADPGNLRHSKTVPNDVFFANRTSMNRCNVFEKHCCNT